MKKDTKMVSLEKKQNIESDETLGILIEYLIKSIPYFVTAFILFYLIVSTAELYHNFKNETIVHDAINTPDNATITVNKKDVYDGLDWYYYLLFTGDYDYEVD